jgi:hypothetical protein
MLKTVLKVSLSFFFFAVLLLESNGKVEARRVRRAYARAATIYYLFDSHREYLISPNLRYTVVWGQNRNSQRIRNYLYDILGEKPVANLYTCNSSPLGFGNISTNWRSDSQIVLITYNGKWAPRAACLVSVNGAQVDVYSQIQNDIREYLTRTYDIGLLRSQDRLVIDFFRNKYLLKITNYRLTLLATVRLPNSNMYSQSFLMTYNYYVTGNQMYFQLVSIQKT